MGSIEFAVRDNKIWVDIIANGEVIGNVMLINQCGNGEDKLIGFSVHMYDIQDVEVYGDHSCMPEIHKHSVTDVDVILDKVE